MVFWDACGGLVSRAWQEVQTETGDEDGRWKSARLVLNPTGVLPFALFFGSFDPNLCTCAMR
jgi:hypothetical protein